MANLDYTVEHVRYMFIIDDDAVQREMIKDYMADRYKFDIKTFEDGESAFDAVSKFKPEIMVLDYHLNAQNPSAKNGVDVLKQIKSLSPNTAVVMFTGEDKLETALESMRNGAYDYVVKGESAFNKIEKVINNLGENHRLLIINQSQKRTITFLGVALAIIVAIAIALGVMGKY
jgi:two-component system, OmpR family, response regulator